MPGIFDRVQAEVDARAPRDARDGLSALELLQLPPADVEIVQRLLRGGATDAAALAGALGQPVADVEARLASLLAKGLVQRSDDDPPRYWLHAVRRRVRVPEGMWARLVDRTPARGVTDPHGGDDPGPAPAPDNPAPGKSAPDSSAPDSIDSADGTAAPRGGAS